MTTYSCLNRYPNTLLGSEELRQKYFSPKLNAYFFNRHRPCFDSILHFYQTGKEAPPLNVDPDVYAKEKEFFGLKREREEKNKIITNEEELAGSCIRHTRAKIHQFLQDPRSSQPAAFWHGMDIFFICISICFLIVESEPDFTEQFTSKTAKYFYVVFSINCVIMGFFTFDFIIRLLTWPSLIDFWKNFFNVLDILSIMPFYVGLFSERRRRRWYGW